MTDDESIGLVGQYLDDQRRNGEQTIVTRTSYLTIIWEMPNIKWKVIDLKSYISPNFDHIIATRAFRIKNSNRFILIVLSHFGSVILQTCDCEGKVTLNHISTKEFVFNQGDCHQFGKGPIIISKKKLIVIILNT